MAEFLEKLFSGEGFPARWHCGRWSDALGYLHIGSDVAIFLAYTAIPLLMLHALRKKARVGLPEPVPRLVGLFVAFILFCGLTHLNEAIIFHHPFYRFAGVAKAGTALVSWATVLALVPALPQLLALRTPQELEDEVVRATRALEHEKDVAQRELAARKKAEAALVQAEEEFRDLFDSAPDMYFSLDPETKKVLRCNRTAEQKLGYAPGELEGLDVVSLYDPDSRGLAQEAMRDLVATGEVRNRELTVLKKDGTQMDVSLSATLRTEADGHQSTRSVLRDISAKKRAERLFELAVEASPSGMIAVRTDGSIALVNREAERLFGYERGELEGKQIEALVPDESLKAHPEHRAGYNALPSTRKMVGTRPLRGKRKDETTFPLEVGLNPMPTPEGLLTLCAVLDRTEVVRHQKALEEKNMELEGFAGAASHDLRAPLRAIKNAAKWIEEDASPDMLAGPVGEHLGLLVQRVDRMDSLLRALLEFARSGEQAAPEDFSLDEVAADLRDTFQGQADLGLDLPAIKVSTSRVRLGQVLMNLIDNAIKHAERDNPVVKVGCTKRGDRLVFTVADNGPGIPPADQKRIFDMFTTLRARDVREGAGMGLALVKKVVQAHGGTISVDSSADGSTFQFEWPVLETRSNL